MASEGVTPNELAECQSIIAEADFYCAESEDSLPGDIIHFNRQLTTFTGVANAESVYTAKYSTFVEVLVNRFFLTYLPASQKHLLDLDFGQRVICWTCFEEDKYPVIPKWDYSEKRQEVYRFKEHYLQLEENVFRQGQFWCDVCDKACFEINDIPTSDDEREEARRESCENNPDCTGRCKRLKTGRE